MEISTSAAIFAAIFGISYLSTQRQIETQKDVSATVKLNKKREQSGLTPGPGPIFTNNNLAYFDTPVFRSQSNGITAYEAEATENYHEIHDAIHDARNNGSPIDQVSILARYYRSKDQAVLNVPRDYDNQYSHLQIRRNDNITANKRLLETIADHPLFDDATKWVPTTKSQPIPPSMSKVWWRPNQYQMPGYTHVKN